jgi:hypothetical protein
MCVQNLLHAFALTALFRKYCLCFAGVFGGRCLSSGRGSSMDLPRQRFISRKQQRAG